MKFKNILVKGTIENVNRVNVSTKLLKSYHNNGDSFWRNKLNSLTLKP